MEAIIFCGIQATGKTTFFLNNFFRTHVHISMDLLNTRNKERRFIETCLELQQQFVVDNTNPTKADRERYITSAKSRKYKIIGYYFQSNLGESLERNEKRTASQRVAERGVKGTYARLQMPAKDEGFDELYYVTISNSGFTISEWKDEI